MIKNQTKLSHVVVLLFIKYFVVIVQLKLSNLIYSENMAQFTFTKDWKNKIWRKESEVITYQQLKSVEKFICEKDKNKYQIWKRLKITCVLLYAYTMIHLFRYQIFGKRWKQCYFVYR